MDMTMHETNWDAVEDFAFLEIMSIMVALLLYFHSFKPDDS